MKTIATNYGVTETAIRWIQYGLSWRDLPWESEDQQRLARQERQRVPGTAGGSRTLNLAEVQRIRQDLEQGVSGSQLAREHGVSRQTISQIKLGVTWNVRNDDAR